MAGLLSLVPKLFGVGSRPPAGVLGRFDALDTATEAIRSLRKAGHTHLTVYTPTPRHELEEALETPESPVRIFTLTGAFAGTATGAFIAIWTSLDWPLLTGGKEMVSIPAFVVIMFEVTILLGALSTVAGLFINSRLPHVGPQEAAYHPSFSKGSFGVFAHAEAGKHDEIRRIMTESGVDEVLIEAGGATAPASADAQTQASPGAIRG